MWHPSNGAISLWSAAGSFVNESVEEGRALHSSLHPSLYTLRLRSPLVKATGWPIWTICHWCSASHLSVWPLEVDCICLCCCGQQADVGADNLRQAQDVEIEGRSWALLSPEVMIRGQVKGRRSQHTTSLLHFYCIYMYSVLYKYTASSLF